MTAKFSIVLINGSEVMEEADSFNLSGGCLIFQSKPIIEGGTPKLKVYGAGGFISVEQLPDYESKLIHAVLAPEVD